jgi:hypothetical protein
MKKYLFGVFALALALTFSAFKAQTDVAAKFTLENPASLTTSVNNWIESDSQEGCSFGTESVCLVVHPTKSFSTIRSEIMSTAADDAAELEQDLEAIDANYSVQRKEYQP